MQKFVAAGYQDFDGAANVGTTYFSRVAVEYYVSIVSTDLDAIPNSFKYRHLSGDD
jgi:hypothetical protein